MIVSRSRREVREESEGRTKWNHLTSLVLSNIITKLINKLEAD